MSTWHDHLRDAAMLVQSARKLVVLTGAGISTESGIPDFRSPGSPWLERPSVSYPDFLKDAAARQEYWETRRSMIGSMRSAHPNAAHLALVELERRGQLLGIITQNIDGLHQDAGSDPARIYELHGTSREAACTLCGTRSSMEELDRRVSGGELEPQCDLCGGYLKAATILFGQRLPEDVLEGARALMRECDLCMVIGSSLKVFPAAYLPRRALQNEVPLLIINREPTPLDAQADVVLHGQAGEILPALMDLL